MQFPPSIRQELPCGERAWERNPVAGGRAVIAEEVEGKTGFTRTPSRAPSPPKSRRRVSRAPHSRARFRARWIRRLGRRGVRAARRRFVSTSCFRQNLETSETRTGTAHDEPPQSHSPQPRRGSPAAQSRDRARKRLVCHVGLPCLRHFPQADFRPSVVERPMRDITRLF